MSQNNLNRKPTLNSEGSFDKAQQTVIFTSGAKIHRACILARIIHSISLYKMQWAMHRIKILASNRKKCYNKMGFAINRIFRRSFHEQKFNALQKIKNQLLQASSSEILYNQKIIQSMSKASKSIIFIVLKAKRRQIMCQSFNKIKNYSIQANSKKRDGQRKAIRKILQFLYKNKRIAFDKICVTRATLQRKNKIRSLIFLLQTQRKQKIGWSFWKLRKNLIDKRKQQVQNDIKMFELKLNNNNDPQLEAIKQKKNKLEQHLNKVQQQKMIMQQQFMAEHKQLQTRRQQYQSQISTLQQKKISLQSQIEQIQNQVSSPYSLDQIYQCVYYNFLLYLSQNKQKIYNKQQVLSTLTFPLIPIQAPIDTIKQQNKVLQQLLNQYIVMFGHKKLQYQISLPYEYLIKQNKIMYKMLLTLLPQVQADREDLSLIRDSLFKLGTKVAETWGK